VGRRTGKQEKHSQETSKRTGNEEKNGQNGNPEVAVERRTLWGTLLRNE
jgi:hypothetical protein